MPKSTPQTPDATPPATTWPTRRDALKTASAAALGVAASSLGTRAYAQGSDVVRVGLIGCGGRGMGALKDTLRNAEGTVVTGLADLFEGQLNNAAGNLGDMPEGSVQLNGDQLYHGWDAYQGMMQSDVDYVIIATPGKFHPYFAKAAVDAGKHCFVEKPGGVDAPGVRILMEAGKKAAEQGTGIASGTQRRHDRNYMDIVGRIHDGAIGDVTSMSIAWCNNDWQFKPRRAEWDTERAYQLWNWRPHIWLSGDLPMTLMVHNADVANWVMGGVPERVQAVGGKIARTGGPEYGNIYDHFGGEYTYSGNRLCSAVSKASPGYTRVDEIARGTEGWSSVGRTIRAAENTRGPGSPSAHMLVHKDFIESLRAGEPLNEAQQLAEATLTAIMFREAAYSGETVTWDFMLNESQRTHGPGPEDWVFDDTEDDPTPVPGQYELI